MDAAKTITINTPIDENIQEAIISAFQRLGCQVKPLAGNMHTIEFPHGTVRQLHARATDFHYRLILPGGVELAETQQRGKNYSILSLPANLLNLNHSKQPIGE